MKPCWSRAGVSPAQVWFLFALCVCLGSSLSAGEASGFELRSATQVEGEGIFLNQLVQGEPALPALRLGDAPALGKTTVFTRAQLTELARGAGCQQALTNWTGAQAVRVSRRARPLPESDALQLLTTALQQQYVKDKGELELRFSRPWTTLTVPDEPFTLKVLDLPNAGVSSAFITRFEFQTARGERLGPFQAALQARVWREVWVARSALKRGDPLREAEAARERRDVLLCRENLAEFEPQDDTLELAEPVAAGAPLLARSLRTRPVVHRGQSVAAQLQDGALVITLKVEALEDGAPGQVIRLRNPLSRRDLRGKVLDQQNILVTL